MYDDDDIQEYVNLNKQRNDVLEEVAKEIEKMKAFEKDTMASFAAYVRGMKRLVADHAQRHGKTFADDQWEALEMIIHKVGRIVNGNPDKIDHWIDIAGYAKLVAMRLEGRSV